MKSKILLSLLLTVSTLSFAQQNTFNKEVELQRFVERGGKVEETSLNIYKLTYRDGTQRVFNFNPAPNQNIYTKDFDTTIINVWEIDTTLYANKFKYWKKVEFVSSWERTAPFEDINNNEQIEWYGGIYRDPPLTSSTEILEQNNNGTFNTVHTYDSTIAGVTGIGDINSDGFKEVYLKTNDTLNGKFYKADSLGKFPTTFDFIFYYYTEAQINYMTFGDFDHNGVTDCSFIDWPITYIATYDSLVNNLYEVFEFNVNDYSSGFAFDDFDEDGKTELVSGTSSQQVYVIEATETNHYAVVWNGLAPGFNSYMLTATNDLDENSKKEFWVGGQSLTNGFSRFCCYESDSDNSYIPVAGIELRNLVSLFTNYLQAVDLDNDGKEELIINIGNYLLILKFTGKPNQHSYDIFYAKIGEATQPGAMFLPSTICDFNFDAKKDILLSMDIYPPPSMSYILIQDTLTSVIAEGQSVPNVFDLSQNYPNPFNPSTQLKVTVKEHRNIRVIIYNILGKEIKIMLNEKLPAGEHTIQWDGKDNDGNHLAGGVYFIQMIAGNYQKTIKTILLK